MKKSFPKAAKSPPATAADEIFPSPRPAEPVAGVESDDVTEGVHLWSSVDQSITMELSDDDAGAWISAVFVRPDDHTVRIELRTSVDREYSVDKDATLHVPLELLPHLGRYFTEMVKRAEARGMLRSGNYSVYQDIETIALDTVSA